MAQAAADILTVNMEAVRKQLPALYEMGNTAYNMLSKSAEKFRISKTPNSTDFRAPLKIQPPAGFGTYSMEGGSLGKGNGFVTKQFSQSYFALSLAVDVNLAAIVATSGGASLSVVNAWKENMKDGIPSFQRMADASFHNQGGANGVFATGTAYSGGVVTCETAWAANLVQVGMPVEVLSADGNTWRTSAVSPDTLPTVSAVDKIAGTFTLTNLGSVSPQATDKYIFRGAVATGTPPVVTWLNGLYYFHDTASSGNILGLDRTLYDIKPNAVNAAGSLVPAHMWQLDAQIRQRRGNEQAAKKLKGLIHPAQVAAIRNLGLSITEIQTSQGSSFAPTDLAGNIGDTITFGGIQHMVDIHQSKTRIDLLSPSDNWCRVYGQELDFHKTPEGKMIFEMRTSAGTPAAGFSFYLTLAENFVCVDLGKEGIIYGLTVPSGF